jgi:uncharacterized membrane protein YhaH (DUF805 family)
MYWYLQVMSKYAVFSGRARRKEYWMFQLVNFVVALVLCAGFVTKPSPSLIPLLMLVIFGYVLATLVPGLAVSVRRLHDINFTGWWLLIGFIPMGGLVLLVFHLLDSTPGSNLYGPNPKGMDAAPYASPYGSRAMSAAAGAGAVRPSNPWLGDVCSACGASLQSGLKFCPRCGKAAY